MKHIEEDNVFTVSVMKREEKKTWTKCFLEQILHGAK